MQGVNKVILIGNLGNDPEIRHLEGNRSKVGFRLATTESHRDREGKRVDYTEWHNIVSWNDKLNTEVLMKFLKKGNPVYVEGQIRTRQYQDRENVTRSVTEIIVSDITLLAPRPASDDAHADSAAHPLPATTYVQEPEPDALPF